MKREKNYPQINADYTDQADIKGASTPFRVRTYTDEVAGQVRPLNDREGFYSSLRYLCNLR